MQGIGVAVDSRYSRKEDGVRNNRPTPGAECKKIPGLLVQGFHLPQPARASTATSPFHVIEIRSTEPFPNNQDDIPTPTGAPAQHLLQE